MQSEDALRAATEATDEFADYIGAAGPDAFVPCGRSLFPPLNPEEGRERLSDEKSVGFAHEVIDAGFEMVASTVEACRILLLTHPDQLAEVQRDPSLWPEAIEETLRVMPPGVVAMPRMATSR